MLPDFFAFIDAHPWQWFFGYLFSWATGGIVWSALRGFFRWLDR